MIMELLGSNLSTQAMNARAPFLFPALLLSSLLEPCLQDIRLILIF